MGKRILFSPVGGTDPISWNNFRDGSLLHICRVWHPDKVYLYLSGDMLELHRKDNRYCYCLDMLQKMEGFQMTYEVIEREALKGVHEYDFFYREFYQLLTDIRKEMKDDDELLLNIASGTPAMKSALLVIQQITEGSAKCIQVVTPDTGQHREIKDYDVKTYWERDKDNEKPLQNRCSKVDCPSLVSFKKLEIIKEQILKYDYHAAISIADTLPGKAYGRLKNALGLAKARQELDSAKVDRLSKKLKIDFVPIKGENRDLFEYALNLQNKLERREYADFIRAITPVLVDLFELVLKDSCNIDINNMTKKEPMQSRKWDPELLAGTEIKAILDESYNGAFDAYDRYVVSDNLVYLIEKKANNDELKQFVRQLRSVESKIRNMAAHEIVSVTEKVIQARTGISGRGIMDTIRKVFTYTSIKNEDLEWDSYQKMNEKIKELISEEMKRNL